MFEKSTQLLAILTTTTLLLSALYFAILFPVLGVESTSIPISAQDIGSQALRLLPRIFIISAAVYFSGDITDYRGWRYYLMIITICALLLPGSIGMMLLTISITIYAAFKSHKIPKILIGEDSKDLRSTRFITVATFTAFSVIINAAGDGFFIRIGASERHSVKLLSGAEAHLVLPLSEGVLISAKDGDNLQYTSWSNVTEIVYSLNSSKRIGILCHISANCFSAKENIDSSS